MKYQRERLWVFLTSRREHVRGGSYQTGQYDSEGREGDVRYFLKKMRFLAYEDGKDGE